MKQGLFYTSSKRTSQFAVKDKKKFEHHHDLVYHAKCHDCDDNYTGEVGRRLGEHICDQSGKDNKLQMLKLSCEKALKNVSLKDFHIVGNSFSKK